MASYALRLNGRAVSATRGIRRSLRIVPFTATFRVLPFGHNAPIQPYLGAGVGVFDWRYSESGQFVDPTDRSIFSGTFVGSGTATGPVVLGGLFDTLGRRPMITATYLLAGLLIAFAGYGMNAGWLDAETQTLVWSAAFFVFSVVAAGTPGP